MNTPSSEYTSNKPYLFRAIFEWLLDNDATPHVLVDAAKPHVDVPQEHVKDFQIVLNISPSAVQSWNVDNEAISFSARFSGVPRQIYVPMNAVLALYAQENGLGMVFPVEEEEAEDKSGSKDVQPNEQQKKHSDVKLQSITKENETENSPTIRNTKKPSHLKVVK